MKAQKFVLYMLFLLNLPTSCFHENLHKAGTKGHSANNSR